jgi:hypothetical protein
MIRVAASKKPVRKPALRSKKAGIYAQAIASGKSQTEAKQIAGYSLKSHGTKDIPAVREALLTVEQQREKMQQMPGISLPDITNRLYKRATNTKVTPGVQTDNDKVLINILGYNAPTKTEIKTTGLLLEFADLTSSDLAMVREQMINNQMVQDCK